MHASSPPILPLPPYLSIIYKFSCPFIHPSIHPSIRPSTHTFIRRVVHLFNMSNQNLKRAQQQIEEQRNHFALYGQLNELQQKTVSSTVKILGSSQSSRTNKGRVRKVRALLLSVTRDVGLEAAILCATSVSFTALAELSKNDHQQLRQWLHSRGVVPWPLSRLSPHTKWISEWISARPEEKCAETVDPPTSWSSTTGEKRRLENTSNERPSKAPRAATAAPLGSAALKPENWDTGIIEETGENGEKDQDYAQLQDCICCSQSLHSTY